jgi:hypothetical protein
MTLEDVADFIEHHGTKGMRWGVRKKRSLSKDSKDKTRYKTASKKLTDDQLNKRISRMETEKRYNSLNSRTVSQGEKLAVEILSNSGRAVATTVITGAALYAMKKSIEKKFGEEAAIALTKRKK